MAEIRILHSEYYPVYETIRKKCGTFFDSLEWLRQFGSEVMIYGIFDDQYRLIGGFHLKQYTVGKFIKIARDPSFSPYSLFFLDIKTENPAKQHERIKKITSDIVQFLEAQKFDIISISTQRKIVDTQPFIWSHYKVIPRYTYVINLGQSEEKIWDNMSPKRRNDIRKAQKKGIVVKKIQKPASVLPIIKKMFISKKIKYDYKSLHRLFNFFSDQNSFIFGAFQESQLASVALCVFDQDTAYYILGAGDRTIDESGGVLVIWESIKYSKSIALKYFDFEGSMVPKIESYFREFGGGLIPFYRINKAKLPLEMILKFFKRELF